MLKKEFRLKDKRDFDEVYKKGRKAASRFFLIKIKPNQKNINRIGFVVSKKSASKIVFRNKLKRRMREVIKLFEEETEKGYDVILIAKPKAYLRKYPEIREEIAELLKKGKLLTK